MIIAFDNVLPYPLRGSSLDKNSAWKSNLVVDSSQNHLLVSDSGKGKTTFLAFAFGSRMDYEGKVLVDGNSWTEYSIDQVSDIRRDKLAYLPQDIRLFPKLSALENLQIKNNLTRQRSEEELIELLSNFGLEKQIKQSAGTLSLGQQQRVGLLRALIQPFELLLLDEPFSHLDQNNIELAIQLIHKTCNENNAGYTISSLGSDYGLSPDKTILL